jgi:3-oxoacyl-[acyl-carrier protein] reductase
VSKCIITGASRGIGLATAKLLISRGHQVLCLSRTPCPEKEVSWENVDLQRLDENQDLKGKIEKFLDGDKKFSLVHNAGSLKKDSTLNLSSSQFREVLEVNLVAPLILNQMVLPLMGEGSSIIYIGSTLAHKAVAGACSYVSSKHGLVGLMRATCQDLVGRMIHTSCICPGFTDTEMLQTHLGADPEIVKSVAGGVSFGRLITPEEQARVVEFCIENPVMNGSVIDSNLGQIER